MTPAQAKAIYLRDIAKHGEMVTFRRYTGIGGIRPNTEITAKARVTGFKPEALVGSVKQGDIRIIALDDDLQAATPTNGPFALPLRVGDKAVVRSKEHNIEAVDLNTRRIAGVLIAPDIQARG